MDIRSEISSYINQLDYKWYSELRRHFVNDRGYNVESKRIQRTVPAFFQYVSEEGEYREDDLKIDCGIEEYCWDYDFENNIGYEESWIAGFVVNRQIENLVEKYLESIHETTEKYKFITNVVQVVHEAIHQLKEIGGNSEYDLVLDYFYNSLRKRLSANYGNIKRKALDIEKVKAFVSAKEQDSEDTSIDSDEQIIRRILKPLSGKWDRIKIMADDDFNQLIKNTYLFFEKEGDLSKINITPLKTNKVAGEFITYTFNLLIGEKIGGAKINKSKWADYLKKSFVKFKDVEAETIRKKFASKPLNYDSDLKLVIRYD